MADSDVDHSVHEVLQRDAVQGLQPVRPGTRRSFTERAASPGSGTWAGAIIVSNHGYVAEFTPETEQLYSFSARMRAIDGSGFAKLHVKWLTADESIVPSTRYIARRRARPNYNMSELHLTAATTATLVYLSLPANELTEPCAGSVSVVAHAKDRGAR